MANSIDELGNHMRTIENGTTDQMASLTRLRGYKTFLMLKLAEHEVFSAIQYENANNSWHFHTYDQRNSHAQLCLARTNLQLTVI